MSDKFQDEDDEIGSCDVCDEPHVNANAIDHCVVCGNCWLHCTCTPKRTLEDNWNDAVRDGLVTP